MDNVALREEAQMRLLARIKARVSGTTIRALINKA